MKRLLFILVACAVLAACKKDKTTTAVSNSYGDPMLPESSGWKRVGLVYNSGVEDQLSPCRFTAYDLQVSGDTQQVIYSEDNLEDFYTMSYYRKASYISGSSDSALRYALPDPYHLIQEPQEQTTRILFRPGTFTSTGLFFFYYATDLDYSINLFDETGTRRNVHGTFFDATQSLKVLANGDMLAGEVNASYICELDYYHAASNSWDYIDQSAGDTQFAITYTPFRLDDGQVLACRLYSKGSKTYLSIADFVPTAVYPAAPYSARFTEEHPEYAPTGLQPGSSVPAFAGSISVVAYTVTGNSVTVVLACQNTATQAYSLSAYRWTEGQTAFQQLYTGIPIATATGDELTKHRDRVGCTPEGTTYALLLDNGTYHLSLTDGNGEHAYGTVSNNNGGRYAASMSCLRYVNGAYYAVVTPFFGGKDYDGQHLDIVRLMP